jgi:hypothetical protein
MTSWGGNRTLMKGGFLHVIYDVNGEFTAPLVVKMFRSLGLTWGPLKTYHVYGGPIIMFNRTLVHN